MTFLQLVRRVARACGMTNQSTIPASVENQTGNLLDAVEWVQDAWRELQVSRPNWRWMRVGFTLTTTPGTDTYAYGAVNDTASATAISRFSHWLIRDPVNPPKAYLQSAGIASQYYLFFLPWDRFQSLYRIGTVQSGMPTHITVDPQNRIVLAPNPDAAYVVTGEYQKSAQPLAEDTDVPELPEDFHMVIAYDAMRKYAGSEAAAEVMVRAQTEGGALKSALRLNQLPHFRDTDPLA